MGVAEAVASFTDLTNGLLRLGALGLIVYAVIVLLPTLRQRGFEAKIFGIELEVKGAGVAVETLSSNIEKQIDDLRAQIEALQDRRGTHSTVSLGLSTPATRTVLWVDDHPSNNLFEVAKLEQQGFTVKQVRSTAEAVKEVQQSGFDLVISDMGRTERLRSVPDAGIRLTKWLRSYEERAQRAPTPIAIYCSAAAIDQYEEEARAAGAAVVTASTTELLQALRDGVFQSSG